MSEGEPLIFESYFVSFLDATVYERAACTGMYLHPQFLVRICSEMRPEIGLGRDVFKETSLDSVSFVRCSCVTREHTSHKTDLLLGPSSEMTKLKPLRAVFLSAGH